MKFLLLLTLLIANGLNSFAQKSNCDSLKFSQSDKKLLAQFWADFKSAISRKDKTKLASLINFPFTCDYCIGDFGHDVNVTRKIFDSKQYKIFFDGKLHKKVSQTPSIIDIIGHHWDNKKCYLDFGYTSVEPSKDSEGQQHFFTLQKINGRFIITSADTIP